MRQVHLGGQTQIQVASCRQHFSPGRHPVASGQAEMKDIVVEEVILAMIGDVKKLETTGYLSEMPFCKTGFDDMWPSLPVGCLTRRGRPPTLKPSFAKRQFRKSVFLGHPV